MNNVFQQNKRVNQERGRLFVGLLPVRSNVGHKRSYRELRKSPRCKGKSAQDGRAAA